MRRIHLWRIRRAYKVIDRSERRLDLTIETLADINARKGANIAAELRREFASDTLQRIARGLSNNGVPKAERKSYLRRVIKGNII